jgi:hypothetical protein
MTAKSASALAFAALLANLAFTATGCSAFDGASDSSTPAPARDPGAPGAVNADGSPVPVPTPVGGAANASELTDAFGVFVSPLGRADADGKHANPLASIQAGIDLAKRFGKRVYVCNGSFHEALTLADAVSIVGGLDCTANEWRVSNSRTRVESPSIPAVRAANIASATRIEGLEIFAPNATQPSGTSIGLLATNASALVIANTKITSGDGMKGNDGTDGIQLANAPTADGAHATGAVACGIASCSQIPGGWLRPGGATAGSNTCLGAPGHTAQPGGKGGSGGVWQVVNDVVAFHFHPYDDIGANGADVGITNRDSATGTNGTDGANAVALGTFTSEGYTPARGLAGTDGSHGFGGRGGAGFSPEIQYNPNTTPASGVWYGFGGAGGGAGGCEGLAGSAGEGGGASIGALLVDSKVTFDGAGVQSGRGGEAGHGALGSEPTPGGNAGNNAYAALSSGMSGKNGGRGGAAGISGNGSNGPSVGIVHFGIAPEVRTTSKIIPGAGGAAIDARSRTTLDITKTIPATPAGLSKDILAL